MALATPSASGNGHDLKTQARVIFTGSPGNLVAGYHGYTDAALTRYFAQAFPPGSKPVVPPLHVASLFACGFIARLIEGWLFGRSGPSRQTPQNADVGRVTELFWLGDDCFAAQLGEYWRRRARLAGVARACSKGESRRRIRGPRIQFLLPNQNHLAGGCLSQRCRLAGLMPKPEIHAE